MKCPICDYSQLPVSVPHPLLCRSVTRRGFISLLTAVLAVSVTLGLARASRAAPCALPQVDVGAVHRTLSRLALPPPLPAPSGWRRLGALLPRKVSWTSRDGHNDGAGWYAGLEGGVSERGLWGSSSGWNLRLVWDLQPLWRAPMAPAPSRWRDPLHRAEQLERLGARLGVRLRQLARLEQRAALLVLGERACSGVRAEARASLLAIGATLAATGGRAARPRRPSAPPYPPAAAP